MFELIYGYYDDIEEKDIYEDIDDVRADAIFRSQNFDYDFVVLKDLETNEVIYFQGD